VIGSSHLDPFDMGVFGTIPRGDVITIRSSRMRCIFDGTTDRKLHAREKSVGSRSPERRSSRINTPDGSRAHTSSTCGLRQVLKPFERYSLL